MWLKKEPVNTLESILSTEQKLPEQQTNIAIKQINLAYHQEQDRLLLRVGLSNGTELVLWLTYRIAKSIWALLNGGAKVAINQPSPSPQNPQLAVAQFHEEVKVADTMKKLDFATEYAPPKEKVNLEVMLATKVSLLENENQPKTLEIVCLEGMNIKLNLNQEITLAICNMLQLTSKEANWQLGESNATSSTMVMSEGKTKQVLH
jgi:hypothetical protein